MYCPNKPNFQKDVSLNELNLHPHFNPRVSYQQQSLRRFNAIQEDFALIGEGGFSIQKTILITDISFVAQPTRFDLTHTFQIEIPASVFNSRLGVFKNINAIIDKESCIGIIIFTVANCITIIILKNT